MAKQRKTATSLALEVVASNGASPQKASIQSLAEGLLSSIAFTKNIIAQVQAEYEAKVAEINECYSAKLTTLLGDQAEDEKALLGHMKKYKAVLFDGTDVVNLPPGSLIHSKDDKVSIPKTALAACEKQGFDEVIKTVKSLDREAIEKWPDARLALIGAERKPKEVFSYDLRK